MERTVSVNVGESSATIVFGRGLHAHNPKRGHGSVTLPHGTYDASFGVYNIGLSVTAPSVSESDCDILDSLDVAIRAELAK